MDSNTQAKIDELLDAPTLYPEVERKDRATRKADLLDWLEKYKEVNVCYNLYGMDRADVEDCDIWLDQGIFSRNRYLKNNHFQAEETGFYYDHTIFTRNKLTFEHLMSYWYGPKSGKYIPSLGVFMNNVFYLHREDGPMRMEPYDFSAFVKGLEDGKRIIFKQGYGEKGKQVFAFTIDGGTLVSDERRYTPEEFVAEWVVPFRTWVVQDYLVQHPGMALFNETSVNTLRIVTYHTGEDSHLDDLAIRIGRPGAIVDNAWANGLYTNVLPGGKLEDSMFCFALKSREVHPHQDAIVPFYQESIDLVLDVHKRIPEVFEIAWDVAITKDGPLVVEANDGGAVFVTQTAFGHAGRPAWDRFLEVREAFEREHGRE